TLYSAMGLWVSGSSALVPRDEVFPSDLSDQQIEQQNERLFRNSESKAETAALRYLGYPTMVVVDAVSADGAANGKLMAGDWLLALDGRSISTAQQVVDLLEGTHPGQLVQVGFQRGDAAAQQVAIELQAGVKPTRGYLGVGLADQPDVDFDITISLVDVGGPSAGLMFALSIVDKLTPGPLAGSTFVAGTGEISPTGEVGPIGGIPFKMIRAHEEGATVFLVPADNCEEAVARAPEGLTLVRVDSLAGAVNALDALSTGAQPPSCAP
ncbi:MAG: YlbL family protein, partial [Pseudonocardiaceae bacterium]